GRTWRLGGPSRAGPRPGGVAPLTGPPYPPLPRALGDRAIPASAQNPPPRGYDDRVGFGTVDAAAALTAAARLSGDTNTGRGVRVATHFGSRLGPTPPVPVAPRGKGRLALYALLALACLAI